MSKEIYQLSENCLAIVISRRQAIFSNADVCVDMGYFIYKVYGKEEKWLHLEGLPGVKLPGLNYRDRENYGVKLPSGKWKYLGSWFGMSESDAAKIIKSKNATKTCLGEVADLLKEQGIEKLELAFLLKTK